jgi:hypothetical protein
MGVLAELYVANDDQQALQYDASPDVFADRRPYRSFTALELSTLWSIMQGAEWDVALMDEFPALLVVNGGERLIHRLPKPMMEALAKMTLEEIQTSSEAWASTEELRCKPSDVQPIIEGLIQLSRKASATGKAVYLWICV